LILGVGQDENRAERHCKKPARQDAPGHRPLTFFRPAFPPLRHEKRPLPSNRLKTAAIIRFSRASTADQGIASAVYLLVRHGKKRLIDATKCLSEMI
jgi:hypothetical protein